MVWAAMAIRKCEEQLPNSNIYVVQEIDLENKEYEAVLAFVTTKLFLTSENSANE